MNIKFDDYENVIDLSHYQYEQRLTEREQAVFAGMADELLRSPLVGDVILGETNELDGWLAVMNKQDEMFTHIEKLAHDRWLIVNHWDQHPTLDQNEFVDAPLPHYREFEGPIEEIGSIYAGFPGRVQDAG